jgi:hypothetical protein
MQSFIGCLSNIKCEFHISTASHVRMLRFLKKKVLLLKVVHPPMIYQLSKLHGSSLTGKILLSLQKFESPPVLNG